MAVPDILETQGAVAPPSPRRRRTKDLFPSQDFQSPVGVSSGKAGSSDTRRGYIIGRSHLSGFFGVVLFSLLTLVGFLSWSTFEIRFERRDSQRKRGHDEHHALTKLAKVEMELWSQLQGEVHNSLETKQLLRGLVTSLDHLQSKFRDAIEQTSIEYDLKPDASSVLLDRITQQLSSHRQRNLARADRILHHLEEETNRSKALRRRLVMDIRDQMDVEQAQTGDADDPVLRAEDQAEFRDTIDAFFDVYFEYKEVFASAIPLVVMDSDIHKKLSGSYDNILNEPSLLKDLDLKTKLGVEYTYQSGSFFMGSEENFVDALLAIPRIPTKELDLLLSMWKRGKAEPFIILSRLFDWTTKHKIPISWVKQGVDLAEMRDLAKTHQKHGEQYEDDDDDDDIIGQANRGGKPPLQDDDDD